MIAALDIGGTKVHGGLVDESGKLLKHERHPVKVKEGPEAFFRQLIAVLESLTAGTKVKKVGIGCAGPLNSKTGELLDPTNFFTHGKSWGRMSLLKPLQEHFPQWSFHLDNDAAAAVLGEHWLGQTKTDSLAVITLGTGVGIGVLVDGKLQRSRQGLHPESSHIPLNFMRKPAPCGCGNFGCIEAYLAVPHFVRRLATLWKMKDLSGEKLAQLARANDTRALRAFEYYGEWMAQSLRALAVLYGPEVVSLTGGFAYTAQWFLPSVEKRLPELLKRYREGVDLLPRVQVSKLGDNLSVLGAARVGMVAGRHQEV